MDMSQDERIRQLSLYDSDPSVEDEPTSRQPRGGDPSSCTHSNGLDRRDDLEPVAARQHRTEPRLSASGRMDTRAESAIY